MTTRQRRSSRSSRHTLSTGTGPPPAGTGPAPSNSPAPAPAGVIGDFLSSEPYKLQQHTVAEVTRSLRAAGVPETEWLQELQGMARDGSLQAFLLTVEQCLARKLRRREQEMLAELALVQQQLCAPHIDTHTHSLSLSLSLSLSVCCLGTGSAWLSGTMHPLSIEPPQTVTS